MGSLVNELLKGGLIIGKTAVKDSTFIKRTVSVNLLKTAVEAPTPSQSRQEQKKLRARLFASWIFCLLSKKEGKLAGGSS